MGLPGGTVRAGGVGQAGTRPRGCRAGSRCAWRVGGHNCWGQPWPQGVRGRSASPVDPSVVPAGRWVRAGVGHVSPVGAG